MTQLPSVSELIGSTRVESATGTAIQTYPHSSSYHDHSHRKDSTTSISSTAISNDGYRRQSTDQARQQRLPSISNTILTTSSKANSLETSPRSSVHLPSISYSLISRNDNNSNNNNNISGSTHSLESPPSSRRSTESTIHGPCNNPGVVLALQRSSSGNYLSNQPFTFQPESQSQSQPQSQQNQYQHPNQQQCGEHQKSNNVRPPVGSPIGSSDALQPLQMYTKSPANLSKQPPSVQQQQSLPHIQSKSTTVSPTHNPQSQGVFSDNVNIPVVPQRINVPPAPPLHVSHGFQMSRSAPTSTTTPTYQHYYYHHHTASPQDSVPGQVGQTQEQHYAQHPQQPTLIQAHTTPPPPQQPPTQPMQPAHHQGAVVAGPGYYIVQQPQQIPLPPTAPLQQVQAFAHPIPPQAVHSQVPPFQPQPCVQDQISYDPHRSQPPGTLIGPPMYAYGVPYADENNALVNKRKIIKRRTRTGCLTCRKRRIKCDERKPSCFNCERSKKVCLGYENLSNLQPRKRIRDTSLDLPVGAVSNLHTHQP
ncbi:hypothetical protein CANMA_005295 [Candida margitis]|uniref:uncharacterized protein n=1 Tax=Candida margitis TaxID=1775924 RepID=UPI0022272377|nr:uncharacterized protein CANMA_005295 [Candida margitis]KAI5950635.1 hypothetical protein CANMA_005295 [Candida margitis]